MPGGGLGDEGASTSKQKKELNPVSLRLQMFGKLLRVKTHG